MKDAHCNVCGEYQEYLWDALGGLCAKCGPYFVALCADGLTVDQAIYSTRAWREAGNPVDMVERADAIEKALRELREVIWRELRPTLRSRELRHAMEKARDTLGKPVPGEGG